MNSQMKEKFVGSRPAYRGCDRREMTSGGNIGNEGHKDGLFL